MILKKSSPINLGPNQTFLDQLDSTKTVYCLTEKGGNIKTSNSWCKMGIQTAKTKKSGCGFLILRHESRPLQVKIVVCYLYLTKACLYIFICTYIYLYIPYYIQLFTEGNEIYRHSNFITYLKFKLRAYESNISEVQD